MGKSGERAADEVKDERWLEVVERVRRSLADGPPRTPWRGKPSVTGIEVLKPHPQDLPMVEPNSTLADHEMYIDTAPHVQQPAG